MDDRLRLCARDGRTLAVAGDHDVVIFWDLTTGRERLRSAGSRSDRVWPDDRLHGEQIPSTSPSGLGMLETERNCVAWATARSVVGRSPSAPTGVSLPWETETRSSYGGRHGS